MKKNRLVVSLAIVALILVAVTPMAGAAAPESARILKYSVDREKIPPPSQGCTDGFGDLLRICPENTDGFPSCGCGVRPGFDGPVFESDI